ncbi:hypothetical protein [Streptomyces sp. NPDC059176]|uniref:protein kinase domain-containing protein n=1 Tax=Streptomyces sp. NPDC059176 TaxID=3346758 RepID=UPI0036825791
MLTPGAPRPTLSSYQNTVAKLAMFAEDPRLKRAVPRLGADGQPGADGGSFGAVYRLEDPEDGRDWALKCFLRDEPDRRTRYQRVSDCLASVHDSWRAEVHYVDRGLFVAGTWWPVLLMEWIDGQRLTRWIDELFHDDPPDLKPRFKRAAREFTDAVYAMHRRGIGHGDLQSGNVLVVPDGAFRFVDYDAMTVPDFQDVPRHEDGHPDFRLPREDEQGAGDGTSTVDRLSLVRTGTFIADSSPAGAGLPSPDGAAAMHRDRFPSHVIHSALVMLGEAPELWAELHRPGGDHLLLSRTDLRNPNESQRWKRLLGHPNDRVRGTAQRLCGMLGSPAAALPDLEPLAEVADPQPFLTAMGWRLATEQATHQRPFLDLDALATARRLASAAPSYRAAQQKSDDVREPEPYGAPARAREPGVMREPRPVQEPEGVREPEAGRGPVGHPRMFPPGAPAPRPEPTAFRAPPPEPGSPPVPPFRPARPYCPNPYRPFAPVDQSAQRTSREPGPVGAGARAPGPGRRPPTGPVRRPPAPPGSGPGKRRLLPTRALALALTAVIAVGGVSWKWPEAPPVGAEWLQQHVLEQGSRSGRE